LPWLGSKSITTKKDKKAFKNFKHHILQHHTLGLYVGEDFLGQGREGRRPSIDRSLILSVLFIRYPSAVFTQLKGVKENRKRPKSGEKAVTQQFYLGFEDLQKAFFRYECTVAQCRREKEKVKNVKL